MFIRSWIIVDCGLWIRSRGVDWESFSQTPVSHHLHNYHVLILSYSQINYNSPIQSDITTVISSSTLD